MSESVEGVDVLQDKITVPTHHTKVMVVDNMISKSLTTSHLQ